MNNKAQKLSSIVQPKSGFPTIGVCATCDPRIDKASRDRAVNIIEMAADIIARAVTLPDKAPCPVVYSVVLVDGEKQADMVTKQFRQAGVKLNES